MKAALQRFSKILMVMDISFFEQRRVTEKQRVWSACYSTHYNHLLWAGALQESWHCIFFICICGPLHHRVSSSHSLQQTNTDFFFSRTAALLLYALKAAVTSDFKAALCPSPLSVRRGEVVCFIATHSSPHCSNVEVVIGLQRFPTCYHVTYCSIQLHKCRIIHSFACNYTK